MAKKKAPKPAPKKPKAVEPLPANTVELRLPKALYDKVSKLDAEVLKHLLRCIFDHDSMFGITQVHLVDSSIAKSAADDKDGLKKLCDGP